MKIETNVKYPDYKKIQEESHYIDCTVVESDFDTHRPNPYRIDYIARDIYRYLKCKNENRF